jgi:hypothetical protein
VARETVRAGSLVVGERDYSGSIPPEAEMEFLKAAYYPHFRDHTPPGLEWHRRYLVKRLSALLKAKHRPRPCRWRGCDKTVRGASAYCPAHYLEWRNRVDAWVAP